jgi:glycosyltransferase involved in cell wall biosynthesis
VPLKILFLSHRFYPDIGGIEVNSEILARAFKKAGHEVRLMTWTDNVGTKNFPFSVIRKPNLKLIFQQHYWADIVYENNPCLRLAWPGILYHRPHVVALRTWIIRMNGKIGLQDIIKKQWLKKSSAVIAVSESVRIKCWPQATVIGNPYRINLFKVLPHITRNIDFAFLGRLVSDKGADIAIHAISRLKLYQQREVLNSNLSLTIIGDGPQKEKLEELVANLGLVGNVCFKGALSGTELVETLNQHRFLLVPSIWEEPFGNVALEGMACGCVPIVSNGGGLPDAVGKAGMVFERGSIEDLVSSILQLIQNSQLIDELRNAACEHLAKHHPNYVAKQYLEVIEGTFAGG